MNKHLKSLFGKPSARMLLTRDLEEAERHRVQHQAHAEYSAAMVTMLDARVARIKLQLQAMNQENQ